MPYKEKRSIEKIRYIRMVQTCVFALLLSIFASVLLIAPTWITISSRLNLANKQVASLENDGMITSSVDLASLGQQTAEVQNKLSSELRVPPTQFISIVRSVTPPGVVTSNFSAGDSKTLEVLGISKNRELLQTFINALSSQDQIISVDNPVSNFVKNKNGDFKLSILFK